MGQCARILMAAGRYDEADARYECLAAARQAGDKELEGTLLQHQGGLAHKPQPTQPRHPPLPAGPPRFQEAGGKGA